MESFGMLWDTFLEKITYVAEVDYTTWHESLWIETESSINCLFKLRHRAEYETK